MATSYPNEKTEISFMVMSSTVSSGISHRMNIVKGTGVLSRSLLIPGRDLLRYWKVSFALAVCVRTDHTEH